MKEIMLNFATLIYLCICIEVKEKVTKSYMRVMMYFKATFYGQTDQSSSIVPYCNYNWSQIFIAGNYLVTKKSADFKRLYILIYSSITGGHMFHQATIFSCSFMQPFFGSVKVKFYPILAVRSLNSMCFRVWVTVTRSRTSFL